MATGPFYIDEKVLVPHTEADSVRHYEAKVLKAEERSEGWYYFLHYSGWSKRWDEWVEAPGILKYEPALVTPVLHAGGNKSRKERSHQRKRQLFEIPDAPECVELEMPLALKKQLVADWQASSKEGRVAQLPRAPCVNDVLQAYVDSKKGSGTWKQEVAEEIADGLRMYFDKALRQMLLYRGEWAQADSFLGEGTLPCSIYGAEHLLRLMIKLAEIMPVSHLTEDSFVALQEHLQELLGFLEEHLPAFFLEPANDYVAAPPEPSRPAVEPMAAAT